MGVLFLLFGAADLDLSLPAASPADAMTTFGMNASRVEPSSLPPLVIPAQPALMMLCRRYARSLAGYQLARGFGKRDQLDAGAGGWVCSCLAFLIWAAAGKSLNLAGLLSTTLVKAVPLTLGALSGILCERAGVVNIAIEGMMLSGAMISTLVASVTDNLWLGLLAGIARRSG